MKKVLGRILSLMLSTVMLLTFMPVMAFADDTYIAPYDLKWDSEHPGTVMFKIQGEPKGYYELRLYRDSMPCVFYNLGSLKQSTKLDNGCYVVDARMHIKESGVYNFDISVAKDDDSIDTEEAVTSLKSDNFTYSRSGKTILAAPTNVKWDPEKFGSVTWDPVEHAEGYAISLYVNDVQEITRYSFNELEYLFDYDWELTTDEDFSSMIGDLENNSYKVKVAALTKNITNYAHSKYSAFTDPLGDTPAVAAAKETIQTAASGITQDNVNDKVESLKQNYSEQAAKDVLRDSIQSSTAVQDNIKTIENEYAKKNNITVAEPTSEVTDMPANKIEVVGSGLSGEAGSTVTLNVTKTQKTPVYDTDIYTNVISFNMSLRNEKGEQKSEITELDIPVTITLPVPSGMDINRLFILHFLSNGEVEEIRPEILADTKVAKFTITHFSTFAFAMEKDEDSSGDGGSTPGGGGSGGGGGGAAPDTTEPTAEDKALVASVTDQINALPAEIGLDNLNQAKAAIDAYNALSEVQKSLVDAAVKTKIAAAEAKYKELTAPADKVKEKLKAIPEDVTKATKAQVTEAREAYDALADQLKALISEADVYRLEKAEFLIGSSEAAAKKPTFKNAKAVKGKKANVSWKKESGADGYQIAYSTSKKFTKKTTKSVSAKASDSKKTLKKLKAGKKYYVRVKAYTKVYDPDKKAEVKVYSKWSKTKSLKAKK